MSTLIRLKRKKSKGNDGVVLSAGEAYYNLEDKRLYVGNEDGENVLRESNDPNGLKKHIAQVTELEAEGSTIKFQIGEDEHNIYEKKITGTIEGVAESTARLQTARTIALSGVVTGSVEFDGSENVTITTSSDHNHNGMYYTKNEIDKHLEWEEF